MEDIQQILQENALLKAKILLKDEQILLKQEELNRKQERILYLERQLFGRRSEKRLPTIVRLNCPCLTPSREWQHWSRKLPK